MKKINLVCLLDVNEKEALIHHFIDYYSDLGVNNFMFVLHSLEQDNPNIIKTENILKSKRCNIVDLIFGEIDFYKIQPMIDNGVREKYLKENEWCILADIDEFIEVDKYLLNSLTENTKWDYFCGVYSDRVSISGELKEIKYGEDIFEQFPVKTEISMYLCHANHFKIPLAKTKVKVIVGHHGLQEIEENSKLVAYPFKLTVNHFKWNSDLKDKLKKRFGFSDSRLINLLIPFRTKHKKWYQESNLFLDNLRNNSGKINLWKDWFIYSKGWHSQEKKFRWSKRKSLLKFPAQGCKKVSFKVTCANLNYQKSQQDLTISVNGEFYEKLNPFNKEFKIEIIKDNILEVAFESNYYFIPKEMNINDDERELSFMLSELRYEP